MATPKVSAMCSSVMLSEMSCALLEEGFSECEADQLADVEVGPIGPVGQRESIERRAGKPGDVEVTEQIRGDLLSKLVRRGPRWPTRRAAPR